MNVWLAVSPCGEHAPGLDVFAERIPAIVPPGTDGATFNWDVGPSKIASLIEAGAKIASPVFEPGDALLFDQLMLHRTGIRPDMTQTRWAIESWFFAPSTFPMEQMPLVI